MVPMDVPQTFGKHYWHLFVEILVTLFGSFQPIIDKLLGLTVLLVDVRFQPRQIKPIDTKGNQVEQ